MILEKYITIKWHNKTKQWFIKLGYEFTEVGKEFEVLVEHLQRGSNYKITASCDKCKKIRVLQYKKYKSLCHKCKLKEIQKANWSDPEYRERVGNSWRKISASNWEKIWDARRKIRGPGCYNWNPNLSDEDRNRRKLPEYLNWAKLVKINGGFVCEICGDSKNLVSHHLMAYRDYPELRHDLKNGSCLCKKCHVEFHAKYGSGSNTKEQFEEFKFYKQLFAYISSVATTRNSI